MSRQNTVLARLHRGHPLIRRRRMPLCVLSGKPRPASLDDLVGAAEQHGRDRQVERLGGLEVDDQLELHWLLHRDIGRLGAFKILSTKAAARRYLKASSPRMTSGLPPGRTPSAETWMEVVPRSSIPPAAAI